MPNTPDVEITNREKALARVIEDLLPDFVKSCRENNDVVVLHQDAFAADSQTKCILRGSGFSRSHHFG